KLGAFAVVLAEHGQNGLGAQPEALGGFAEPAEPAWVFELEVPALAVRPRRQGLGKPWVEVGDWLGRRLSTALSLPDRRVPGKRLGVQVRVCLRYSLAVRGSRIVLIARL